MLNSISSTSYTNNNYSVTNSGQTNNVLNTTSNPYGGDNFTYNKSLTLNDVVVVSPLINFDL